jgi:hypothetical protein
MSKVRATYQNGAQVQNAPRGLECRHRFLTARRVTAIMRVLRHQVEPVEDDGAKVFAAVCKLKLILSALEGTLASHCQRCRTRHSPQKHRGSDAPIIRRE